MSKARIEVDEQVEAETDDVIDEVADLVGHLSKDQQTGDDELGLYEDWMPDAENYQGKTNIEWEQAHALAGLRQLNHVYEMLGINIDGLEQMLIALVEDYEQYRTSIEGRSRAEQVRVLMAKAGVSADMDDVGRSVMARMLVGKDDDDE